MATTRQLTLPEAPVWVMEEPPFGTGRPEHPGSGASRPALAIAGRLGVPFRRIGAAGGGRPAGSPPALIVSSGLRSAAQALLVKARHGTAVVHCRQGATRLPERLLAAPFDLLVLPSYGMRPGGGAPVGRVLPILGQPQAVSPGLLSRARVLWADRLAHLPWPRFAVLLGGGAPSLRAVVALARRLTGLVRARGGCVLASALPECPPRIADAFAAGLSEAMHLVYRADEPGPDPTLGFLGGADATIVAWTGPQALSEACATDGPVFVLDESRERGMRSAGRAGGDAGGVLLGQLLGLDLVRRWGQDGPADPLAPWPRLPLDEAGRIARVILRRYAGLADRSLEPDLPERA